MSTDVLTLNINNSASTIKFLQQIAIASHLGKDWFKTDGVGGCKTVTCELETYNPFRTNRTVSIIFCLDKNTHN